MRWIIQVIISSIGLYLTEIHKRVGTIANPSLIPSLKILRIEGTIQSAIFVTKLHQFFSCFFHLHVNLPYVIRYISIQF